jgi:tetratricopeptide (TPR) repeat protein
MLDMRPGNIPGLIRAATLRETYGDLEGSIMLLGQAYQESSMQETEDRAWLLTRIARLQSRMGKFPEAERALGEASRIFPGYAATLNEIGELRIAQGQPEQAVAMFQQLVQLAPRAENLYSLAEALRQAHQAEEAQAAYSRFEEIALRESTGWDNANRELIAYYSGPGHKPEEALRIARLEHARRQDLPTLLAYTKALEANGKTDEVKGVEEQMAKAIAK